MNKKKNPEELTTEQIHNRNEFLARVFSILAPITKYIFLLLTILFLYLMIKNSMGNIKEIVELLDEDVYSGIELTQNYEYLIEKWGEVRIIGLYSTDAAVRYVDVGNALFSGLMITFSILASITFSIAVIFGKIVFPLLTKHYKSRNKNIENLGMYKVASATIDKPKEMEWF